MASEHTRRQRPAFAHAVYERPDSTTGAHVLAAGEGIRHTPHGGTANTGCSQPADAAGLLPGGLSTPMRWPVIR